MLPRLGLSAERVPDRVYKLLYCGDLKRFLRGENPDLDDEVCTRLRVEFERELYAGWLQRRNRAELRWWPVPRLRALQVVRPVSA